MGEIKRNISCWGKGSNSGLVTKGVIKGYGEEGRERKREEKDNLTPRLLE